MGMYVYDGFGALGELVLHAWCARGVAVPRRRLRCEMLWLAVGASGSGSGGGGGVLLLVAVVVVVVVGGGWWWWWVSKQCSEEGKSNARRAPKAYRNAYIYIGTRAQHARG